MKSTTHSFIVQVSGENLSPEEAQQVMSERLSYDEDYGFDYIIESWNVTESADVAEEDDE